MSSSISIGIMQGRLSPPEHNVIQSFPRNSWELEFERARQLGLTHIEWIFDSYSMFNNPLFTEVGRLRIRELAEDSQVRVTALCADYFRDHPLKALEEVKTRRLDMDFRSLLTAAAEAAISMVMIPYVDHARIEDQAELDQVAAVLRELVPLATEHGVTISLETNLPPGRYQELLTKVNLPELKVNYDTGDSAALGFDAVEEFSAYGAWICNVHIKDRPLGGTTVPLGDGSADIPSVLRLLRKVGYEGGLTLQAARKNSEFDTIQGYKSQLETWIAEAA